MMNVNFQILDVGVVPGYVLQILRSTSEPELLAINTAISNQRSVRSSTGNPL
jgi:hypothetical protein